jgi:hypothetical protein
MLPAGAAEADEIIPTRSNIRVPLVMNRELGVVMLVFETMGRMEIESPNQREDNVDLIQTFLLFGR